MGTVSGRTASHRNSRGAHAHRGGQGVLKGEAERLEPSIEAGEWKVPATAETFVDTYQLTFWEGDQRGGRGEGFDSQRRDDRSAGGVDAGRTGWRSVSRPVTMAKDDRAYVVDRIGVPFDNPWGSMMLFSGSILMKKVMPT